MQGTRKDLVTKEIKERNEQSKKTLKYIFGLFIKIYPLCFIVTWAYF